MQHSAWESNFTFLPLLKAKIRKKLRIKNVSSVPWYVRFRKIDPISYDSDLTVMLPVNEKAFKRWVFLTSE